MRWSSGGPISGNMPVSRYSFCAFLRCSQCGADLQDDPGMMEKLERIISCGVDTAHIGICASHRDGTHCLHMQKTADWLEEKGIRIVWGTH